MGKRLLDGNTEHRKQFPMATGLLDYFPDALAEVAKLSKLGSDKHNPGQPLHHSRGKSMDHADCIMRHLAGRGGFDGETRESASLAWRALALLQEELEAEHGLSLPRGAKAAEAVEPEATRSNHKHLGYNPGDLLTSLKNGTWYYKIIDIQPEGYGVRAVDKRTNKVVGSFTTLIKFDTIGERVRVNRNGE